MSMDRLLSTALSAAVTASAEDAVGPLELLNRAWESRGIAPHEALDLVAKLDDHLREDAETAEGWSLTPWPEMKRTAVVACSRLALDDPHGAMSVVLEGVDELSAVIGELPGELT